MKKRSIVIIVVAASAVIVLCFVGLIVVIGLTEGGDYQFEGFGSKVAVVELYGQIYDSKSFVRQMNKWDNNSAVKAIVIDINSPGGGVAASQEMYDAILKVREGGKLVVASMSSVAASGGYYVACAADKIVANPGTLTGSIGVILSFPTAKKLFDKIGVRWETVKSGDLKAVGSYSRPMSAEEERMLKAVVDDSYEQFVEAVSEGRDRPKEEIYPLADGSIFTGRQAYNLGLVDTLGSFQDAVSLAGEMVGLGSDPDTIKERRKSPGLFDVLSGGLKVAEKITDLELGQPGLLYLYQ
ncbi:MAG: signal peptide peptidase SppA [FCB group bacterium]|nr:signal peptide peptidase SppA [FCB group bacterium]